MTDPEIEWLKKVADAERGSTPAAQGSRDHPRGPSGGANGSIFPAAVRTLILELVLCVAVVLCALIVTGVTQLAEGVVPEQVEMFRIIRGASYVILGLSAVVFIGIEFVALINHALTQFRKPSPAQRLDGLHASE